MGKTDKGWISKVYGRPIYVPCAPRRSEWLGPMYFVLWLLKVVDLVSHSKHLKDEYRGMMCLADRASIWTHRETQTGRVDWHKMSCDVTNAAPPPLLTCRSLRSLHIYIGINSIASVPIT